MVDNPFHLLKICAPLKKESDLGPRVHFLNRGTRQDENLGRASNPKSWLGVDLSRINLRKVAWRAWPWGLYQKWKNLQIEGSSFSRYKTPLLI